MNKAVAVALPPPDKAPGIRDGIRERAEWQLSEIVEGWGLIEPKEGSGVVHPYFKTTKLGDGQSPLSPTAFDPLTNNPGWPREEIPLRTDPSRQPTAEWSKTLIEWGEKVAASGRRGSDLSGL